MKIRTGALVPWARLVPDGHLDWQVYRLERSVIVVRHSTCGLLAVYPNLSAVVMLADDEPDPYARACELMPDPDEHLAA